MKQVEFHSGHRNLFEDMIKSIDGVWCEASAFNNDLIIELIYHSENLTQEQFKARVDEVLKDSSILGCDDYGKIYGSGYYKFIRHIMDYALRFVLSERAKQKHLNEPTNIAVDTYNEHLEARAKREKPAMTIKYSEKRSVKKWKQKTDIF